MAEVMYATTAWTIWTSDCATSSTCDTTWGYWTSGTATTTASVTTNGVWLRWTDSTSTATSYQSYQPQPQLTPEERARIAEESARRAEEARKAAEQRRKEAEKAAKRAEKLLREVLSPEQRAEFDKDKSFHVIGADGHRYRVRHGWSGHVERIADDGLAEERFCIHPDRPVPNADNQLIAKLMLETDPARFRKIANVTRLRERAAVG